MFPTRLFNSLLTFKTDGMTDFSFLKNAAINSGEEDDYLSAESFIFANIILRNHNVLLICNIRLKE